ncbi:XrtN system VIT domain-containing protein [Fibrella aquatilis]|uniref:XrtN system VIT domain-containing protein n=1 Tax=Fibrella aquatilis TaxID=2817059 RepID=A0A939G7Q2_9BACT|nr:XrtN system VIT domain-containing protein [Fibrella aquatilis]MBO0932174.1 XrtN system VIT domain-containing protein [Fibrella aquatilis]
METEIDYQTLADEARQELLLSPTPGNAGTIVTGWKSVFRDEKYEVGVSLFTVSGLLFLSHDWLSQNGAARQDTMTWFMGHYALALVFGTVIFFNGGYAYYVRHDRRQQASVWVSLVLWWLSAFALNRQMAVFEQSVPWLSWVIVGSGLLMVLHTWADILPRWGQQLLYAGLTGTWLLVVYQAVYVAQLYPISVPGLLVLGISIHTFIPALMAWVVGRQLWVAARQRPYLRHAVVAGLLVPLNLLVIFLLNWHHTVAKLNQVQRTAALRQTNDLPDWVQMAQQLHPGPVTDRILKTNIVYGTTPWTRSFGDLTVLDDVRLHDPLVVIAHNLFPVPVLDGPSGAKLLRTVSKEHYGTETKLWSGRNLTTTQVATQVKIWPQYRLGYTEKTLWVQSAAQWGNREVLYTFHLPEGSAVSALSLWIDGREAPARLTTQTKADSAYKTIVGVESRDPSVVTWQEGNRVTVRVFPVMPGKVRQVKIGITSPLQLIDSQLVYRNPWFEGPDASKATETVNLSFDTEPTALTMRGLSGEVMNRTLTRERDYQPDWSLEFTPPPLSPEPFRLDGKAYQVGAYRSAIHPFWPTDLYLDVNESWTADEFSAICETVDSQHTIRLWVVNDGLLKVTPTNRDSLFAELVKKPFSLFPIDRINSPATALLITKGADGPTLADLNGSLMADRLAKKSVSLLAPINAVNLGVVLPPYLKTLTELGVLHMVTTNLTQLRDTYLTRQQFPTNTAAPDEVSLPNSGMVIRQLNTGQQADNQRVLVSNKPQTASLAPDHLLRLFTYNQLMQRVGRRYFDKAYRNDSTLAAVAQKGHVVSPVSSLVVLETQQDYDRFDIKKDQNGLDNATLKQDGAVPEPHEWAMLVVVALLVGWFYAKR